MLYPQTFLPAESIYDIIGNSLFFTIIGEGMEAFISMPTIWLSGLAIEYLRRRKRSNKNFITYSTLIITAITLAYDTIVFMLMLTSSRQSVLDMTLSFIQMIAAPVVIATTISMIIFTNKINLTKSA